MSARGARAAAPWLAVGESGSVVGLRILAVVGTWLGRLPVKLILRGVALYYALFSRLAMRCSADYLRRLGLPHGFAACYTHVLRFAECTTDRLYFVLGKHQVFRIERTGNEHLAQAARSGRGAILLGAHLGSFEAMNCMAETEGLVVNVVGYFGNAPRINQVLQERGRGVHARLIEAKPGSVNFVLQLRDCIERGEFVALLADRFVEGSTAEVDFLGGRANLPTGPYALAAVLGCPVFLTFGLYHAPDRYALYCEPFADRIQLPRKTRQEALAEHAQRFADRLEHYCRLAPHNWFNFYPFWSRRD
jgi:predicted LPLAT superfamily acyltransferase